MVLFAQTLLIPSRLSLRSAGQQFKSRLKILQIKEHPANPLATRPVWLNFAKGTSGGAINFPFIGKQAGMHSPFKKEPVPESAYLQEIRLGFYESRDPGIVSLPLLRNMGEEGGWLPEAAEGLINAARLSECLVRGW